MLDAAAVGEVQETFIVSSSVIQCIAPIPTFNDQDPDVLASKFALVNNLEHCKGELTLSNPHPIFRFVWSTPQISSP